MRLHARLRVPLGAGVTYPAAVAEDAPRQNRTVIGAILFLDTV